MEQEEEQEKIKDQGEEKEVEADTDTAESSEEATTEDETQEEVSGDETPAQEQESVSEQEPQEKMLTQSQVNELVGKARAEGRQSAMKELYERYGVNTDEELNDIFGRGQGYDLLNEDYNSLNGRFSDLSAENALLKSKVLDTRWDDVKAILKSKGMDVTTENIATELATHPEWCGNLESEPRQTPEFTPEMGDNIITKSQTSNPVGSTKEATGTIRKLGSNIPDSKDNLEDADINRLFGM